MSSISVNPLEFKDRSGAGRLYPSQSHLFVDVSGPELELNAISDVRTTFHDGLTDGKIVSTDPAQLLSNSVQELRRIPIPANIANYRQRGPHNVASLRVELLNADNKLIAAQTFAVDGDAFEPVSAVIFN